ncbi:ComEC/Rec2 family competence protein [Demequina sp. SYSU T00192]|uniref:ComEC/Rec2 family competence protein n=1 Tax=Demequina litoralis TaxID=3051660 RepID=A0ABT8GC07_9MICO|nr:ComEC/Rec2 family competence protein [Demequina sp. SYSU T00192]MDN4476514.1 ComEC/Rec2 family competence protein [Demequina sp. SYSU T00192]
MGGWGDVRLVPAAVATWVASLASWAGGMRGGFAVAGACAVAAILATVARRRVGAGAIGAVALAAVAAVASTAGTGAASAARAWIPAHTSTIVEVSGRVVEVRPVASHDEPRVAVRVAAARWREAGQPRWRAGAGLVVVLAEAEGAPVRGGTATVRGTTAPAAGGPVDALLDGRIVANQEPTGWRAAAEEARVDFGEVLAGAPEATSPLVAGMVLGDTSAMDPGLVAQMRATGLAHLTAVSGAHFAILAVAVGTLLRRARASPAIVAVGTVAACGAFGVVVSGGGSVLRALAMAAIAAGALLAGRRGQSVPALAATVVVLLLMRPELARDAGLALSVAAVGSIALLAPGLAGRLRRRVAAPLADAAAVTLAAQAACLPILAAIDAGVGPWAVPANAVATPFAIPVTLLGVAALALAGPAPALAQVLADASARCAYPVVAAARAFAEAPGGDLLSDVGARGVVQGGLLLAAVAAAARAPRPWWRAGALVAAVLGLVLHAPPRWLPEALGGAIDGWTVVACDVGQGDALVVRGGGGVVMVDVGTEDADAAGCLDRLGVSRVDLLVLSHEHADHTGGVAPLREAVDVGHAWLPAAPSEQTLDALAGIPTSTPAAGEQVRVGGVTVEVLQTGPTPRSRDGTEVNDSSTALRIEAAGLVVVALGDLEVEGQRRLEPAVAALGVVDIVKAAHHGSAAQDAALVRAIAAPVALVSVGAGNDYGHPSPEALDLYGGGGAVVLRTDVCGDVVLGARDGEPVLVRRCRDSVGG